MFFLVFFEFYIFYKNNNDIMTIFTMFKEHLYYNFFNMMYLDNIFYRNEKNKGSEKIRIFINNQFLLFSFYTLTYKLIKLHKLRF